VLEMLSQVYNHDAEARDRALTPDQRLRLHQERSAPVMDELHVWLESQLAERRTERNSGLGQAITYLLRHWQPLTLFLRQAGAPLDNNLVERALKRAVLHRKNALFYRTLNGAQVGDLFMSLIQACQLCGANSFDYLIELQRHAQELAARPTEWMPWNYRDTLVQTPEL
jgi:transposase